MIQKYIEILYTLGKGILLDDNFAYSLAQIIAIISVVLAGYLICVLVSFVINKSVTFLAAKTKTLCDDFLVKNRVFNKLCLLIPAIMVRRLAGDALPDMESLRNFIIIITKLYEIIIYARVLSALLYTCYDLYNTKDIAKTKSMKSLLQVVLYIVYIIAFLLMIATLTGKNVSSILIGLGTLSAVLMLIFKDSILGFVGGILLSMNDMVRLGDWITVKQHNADGNVIDIGLTTVKVQNFDNTITTIPTYSLVSESFTNWRGMTESGGRRIQRSIIIDINTVKFCEEELLEKLKKITLIKDYIDERQKEIEEYNKTHSVNTEILVNGRRQTNLGVFRIYILEYLKRNANINQDLTVMVRQLQPVDQGVPLEIYAFSKNKNWEQYEVIQADIFDHIIATVPMFDLKIFQKKI